MNGANNELRPLFRALRDDAVEYLQIARGTGYRAVVYTRALAAAASCDREAVENRELVGPVSLHNGEAVLAIVRKVRAVVTVQVAAENRYVAHIVPLR